MSEPMKMGQNQEQSLFTLTDEEEITGKNCPVCGYPTVREYGLEVCYHCGWSEGDEPEGYYEE